MTLDRYRGIIPDWSAFHEASHTPEAVTLRVRRGSIQDDQLIPLLEARGFELESVEGVPHVFRVRSGPGSVAQTPEHWIGLFHVQQAVMALPSLTLDPQPGERILDLCAAPGGKTVHLAELMEDRGPLVAVDPKEKRLRGLLGNVYRLGHPNVLVVAGDGRELPEAARFDRVLVDAPCSAEGNYRRKGGRLPRRSSSFVRYVTTLQEALLRRAIRLTRPGGLVVYSTCTFAPEENEGIVARILDTEPVVPEAIPLDLPHAPGLRGWEGQDFPSSLRHAWRVYPQHLDSGGLFMVRLRRLPQAGSHQERDEGSPESGASPPRGWSPVPEAFPGEDPAGARERIQGALQELETRYGMKPEVLDSLRWLARRENLWAHTAHSWPVDAWRASSSGHGWRVVSLGLRGLRRGPGDRETPSNHFLGRFGHAFGEDRKVEVGPTKLLRLLRGERLPAGDLPTGPVALLWEGRVLGRGMVGRRGLGHQIAGSYAKRLQAVLEGSFEDASE